MPNPPSANPRRDALDALQVRLARDRAAAFVDYVPVLCGVQIKPITHPSFSQLQAFGNAFFTGSAIAFDDIVNFIWIHHPAFGQFARREKKAVTNAVYDYLNPSWSTLNRLVLVVSGFPRWRWLRRFTVPTPEQRLAETIGEIRRLLNEAAFDIPKGSDDGAPIPFAYSAFLINLFHRHLAMPFDAAKRLVETMPLKQLNEYLREVINHTSRGKAMLLTEEEAAIWSEDLKIKTEAAQAAARTPVAGPLSPVT